jgi:hypothetical protein
VLLGGGGGRKNVASAHGNRFKFLTVQGIFEANLLAVFYGMYANPKEAINPVILSEKMPCEHASNYQLNFAEN